MEILKKDLYDLRQALRNKTKLHEQARLRVVYLEEVVKKQKVEIELLKTERIKDKAEIVEFRRQIEALNKSVFKVKPKKKEDDPDDINTPTLPKSPRVHTTRPIPEESSVTKRITHKFSKINCNVCTNKLTAFQTVDYYQEDIELPHEKQQKQVIKTSIERGWCKPCSRWRYAKPPPSAVAIFGTNVKAYISYLYILLRLSYEQIQLHLSLSYHLAISDGEIAHILTKEAVLLQPEYEAIDKRINLQPGMHEDETPWKVQLPFGGSYGWVKTGTKTDDVLFCLGESRGKGIAKKITGIFHGIGITDDYSLYHRLFGDKHQLCWAHPFRKLRDLAQSKVFDEATHQYCIDTWKSFSEIYSSLRGTLALPWDSERNKQVRSQLITGFLDFSKPDIRDPKALKKIKKRFHKVYAKYFTCLLYEGIPPDNNKAERALRHMVIKRRTSFGSKTKKGADVTAVLASVILSTYRTKGKNFWSEYMSIRGV